MLGIQEEVHPDEFKEAELVENSGDDSQTLKTNDLEALFTSE